MWSTIRPKNSPKNSRPCHEVSDSASRQIVVVADASPLIGLAKIARLDLLQRLFGEVLIPEAVERELCLGSGRPGSQVLSAARHEGWIKVEEVSGVPAALEATVDQGEAEAITLAKRHAALLLIDETRGRAAARSAGLRVFGSGTVLIKAKQEGFLAAVAPELGSLSAAGYHLSLSLQKEILHQAGE